MGERATVEVYADRTTKAYHDHSMAQSEADWYQRVPWACPELLDFDGFKLTIATAHTAEAFPEWRPVGALREILVELHRLGVHHRDVHVKNVVKGPRGTPLLIDWETALHFPSRLSYDLHGPDASGVQIPDIHRRLIPAWWNSIQRTSIMNQWEVTS